MKGLAIAAVIASVASPATCANKLPTAEQKAAMNSFDAAIQSSRPLEAIASLPFAPNAEIVGPQNLGKLRLCKMSGIFQYRNWTIGNWEPTEIGDLSCGSGIGYFARFEWKKDKIRRITVAVQEIIVTSGQKEPAR